MNDKQYPLRTRSHQLEEASKRYFDACLPKHWTGSRTVGGEDYGLDLRVSMPEGENYTGLELAVQLKSSASSNEAETEVVRLKVSTLNYLKNLLQVVMVVKYVDSENEAYWLMLRDVQPPATADQETLTVRIPRTNRLSEIRWDEIQANVRLVTDRKLAAERAWRANNPG